MDPDSLRIDGTLLRPGDHTDRQTESETERERRTEREREW